MILPGACWKGDWKRKRKVALATVISFALLLLSGFSLIFLKMFPLNLGRNGISSSLPPLFLCFAHVFKEWNGWHNEASVNSKIILNWLVNNESFHLTCKPAYPGDECLVPFQASKLSSLALHTHTHTHLRALPCSEQKQESSAEPRVGSFAMKHMHLGH